MMKKFFRITGDCVDRARQFFQRVFWRKLDRGETTRTRFGLAFLIAQVEKLQDLPCVHARESCVTELVERPLSGPSVCQAIQPNPEA